MPPFSSGASADGASHDGTSRSASSSNRASADRASSDRASAENASASDDRRPAVHVRFPPSEGRRLRRPEPTSCPGEAPLWAERPLLMKRADGTYELIGIASNLDGLARWVLSFGAGAEVRSPDRLRRRVAAEARRVWQRHHESE